MNIAIVDDCKNDLYKVKNLIDEFFNKKFSSLFNEIKIEKFESGEEFLSKFQPNYFNLVILDIYMNKISGIDVAKEIFNIDKSCNIIFLTNSDEFVFDSFEVRTLFYILKPVSENKDKLFTALDYFMENFNATSPSINVKINNQNINVPFNKIIYVDCSRRISNFHLKDNILISNRSLSNYSPILLKNKRFIECFRGVIVNMDYIRKVNDNEFVLKNNEIVPIAKRKKSHIKNTYFEYFVNSKVM